MPGDPFFHMLVEDVFSIANRGTVVTGKIDAGTLKVGDEIVIRGRSAEKTLVVAGIEAFRKAVDQANSGDPVGIMLKDISRKDVQKGDEMLSPESGR
jgi:elongation factor Tu